MKQTIKKLYDAINDNDLETIQATFKSIVEAGLDINSELQKYTDIILTYVCRRNNIELVKFFVEQGCDVNGSPDKYDPICAAAANGHLEIVKFLVEKGANLYIENKYTGNSLLYNACINDNNAEIIKYLYEIGVDLNDRDCKNLTPLMYISIETVIKDVYIDNVKALLDCGVNPKQVFNDGTPLLMVAAIKGNVKTAKLIYEYIIKQEREDAVREYIENNGGNINDKV